MTDTRQIESIKQVLMRRDGVSEQDAQDLIDEARAALQEYLDLGNYIDAQDVCQEFFGLEPDYLDELMGGLV